MSCHGAGGTGRRPGRACFLRSGYCGCGCFHPHLHCIVPGGGLQKDRWIHGRRRFLLPVRVLSAHFRNRFLKALRIAYAQGKLEFPGECESLRDPVAFARFLAPLNQARWVVYAQPPFGGPQHVLEYLGRYTHRIAISNRRLVKLEDGQVSFQWKDYRDPQQPQKIMTVAADDFIRRFLQHALPSGFQRIRYYGFLANCHRRRKLEQCRQLLATTCSDLLPSLAACQERWTETSDRIRALCPQCHRGMLARYLVLPNWHRPPVSLDTS